VWLLLGVWKLKGITHKADKERCLLCSGEEQVEHILLDCLETKNWRTNFLNGKRLNMNTEIVYRKILRRTNKAQIINLSRYLDQVKNKWFKKIKDL
jgi:hypothetical protein